MGWAHDEEAHDEGNKNEGNAEQGEEGRTVLLTGHGLSFEAEMESSDGGMIALDAKVGEWFQGFSRWSGGRECRGGGRWEFMEQNGVGGVYRRMVTV